MFLIAELSAAQMREMLRQGGPKSSKPSGSTPIGTSAPVPPTKSPTLEQRTEPQLVTARQPKRKKSIGSEKNILVPEWNVGTDETLFGTTGARADAADLLQGIFLPGDQKKLDSISSVESVKALSILMAKVILHRFDSYYDSACFNPWHSFDLVVHDRELLG